jgi:transposase
MLVVGYVVAIRSERLICREVQVNLAYRWFCKLGIEDAIPDHSAFSRARNERFREGDVFRRLFERVVEACIAAGLVGGEGFAVDASPIQADANRQRSIAGQEATVQRYHYDRQSMLDAHLSHLNRHLSEGWPNGSEPWHRCQ